MEWYEDLRLEYFEHWLSSTCSATIPGVLDADLRWEAANVSEKVASQISGLPSFLSYQISGLPSLLLLLWRIYSTDVKSYRGERWWTEHECVLSDCKYIWLTSGKYTIILSWKSMGVLVVGKICTSRKHAAVQTWTDPVKGAWISEVEMRKEMGPK